MADAWASTSWVLAPTMIWTTWPSWSWIWVCTGVTVLPFNATTSSRIRFTFSLGCTWARTWSRADRTMARSSSGFCFAASTTACIWVDTSPIFASARASPARTFSRASTTLAMAAFTSAMAFSSTGFTWSTAAMAWFRSSTDVSPAVVIVVFAVTMDALIPGMLDFTPWNSARAAPRAGALGMYLVQTLMAVSHRALA